MAKQSTTILGLAGAVLALVAAALFVLFSDPAPSTPGAGGDTQAEAPEATPETAGPETGRTGRKRARVPGDARLFGQVRHRGTDTPAEGETVVLITREGGALEAATDAEGAFRFEKLTHGGPYEVRLESDGAATIRLPGIALERSDEYDVGTLWLAAAVRLEVRVVAWDDQPIDGAVVEAYAAPEVNWNTDWTKRLAQFGVAPVAVASATTGPEGSAVFEELAVGSWTFTARKDGYAREGRPRIVKADEESEPLIIRLGTGHRLSGRVLDQDDAPIADALIMVADQNSAWNPASAAMRFRTHSDAEGNYAFDNLPSGDKTLWGSRPGGVPSSIFTVRVPEVRNIDLRLRLGGRIFGTVTEKDTGEPLADVSVRATGWQNGSMRVAEATTDAEGKYAIENLLEGPVNQVTAELEGWVIVPEKGANRGWQPIPLERGAEVEKNLVLRKGATLSGVVTGPDGPISSARVMVYARQTNGGVLTRTTSTDAAGKYRLLGMSEGTVIAQVQKQGFIQADFPQNWWQSLSQGNAPEQYSAEVPAEGEATLDIALVTGTGLTGRVEDGDGEPVAGATVRAWGGGTGTGEVKSADDGSFTLTGVAEGVQLNVWAQLQGYTNATQQVLIPAGGEAEDVVLVLRKGAMVRGIVSSRAGIPLKDAYVQVLAGGANMQVWQWQGQSGSPNRVPVLPDGSFEAPVLQPEGQFTVMAGALGHQATVSDPVQVVPGTEEYQVNVVLGEGQLLTGQVNSVTLGGGVPGARITIQPIAAQAAPAQRFYTGVNQQQGTIVAVADESGAFQVAHMPEGRFSVIAAAEEHIATSAEATIPGTTQVTIDLEPALAVAGTVRYAGGEPVSGAMVMVQEDTGTEQPFQWGGNQVYTSADGSFRMGNLGSGSYRVTVMNQWNGSVNIEPYRSDPVQAGTENVELIVRKGGVIAGTVADQAGKPVPGCYVNAQPEKPTPGDLPVFGGMQTDEDGAFELVGLKPGIYRVFVNAQNAQGGGYRNVQRDGVAVGTVGLDIVVEKGLKIEGTVVDDKGVAVASRFISARKVADEQGNRKGGMMQNTQTDAKGHFEVAGLEPGRYKLELQNWGGAPGGNLVLQGAEEVPAGSQGLHLIASRGAAISGVVVDTAGGPLTSAWVTASPTEGGKSQTARPDAQGNFEITGLEEGKTYNVSARAPNRRAVSQGDVGTGTAGLRFELIEGLKVSGRLISAAGDAMPNTRINFQNSQARDSQSVQTDAKGKFTLGGLTEGDYQATVYRRNEDNNSWTSVQCGIVRGGDMNVELRLEK